jgi:glutathione S-transferase
MFGLANELCGEMGLGWCLRLLMIDASLQDPQPAGAFPERVAQYLGKKYGYSTERVGLAEQRVKAILIELDTALGAQPYFFETLSALDIYWAAFGNMFMLLDTAELPAAPLARDAWNGVGGGRFKDDVPNGLRTHHRKIYEQHLGLPVQL